MSKIFVDVEELKKYASYLKRYSQDLSQGFKRTGAELDRMNDTWKDDVYNRFRDKYKHSTRVIEPLVKDLDEYSRHLMQKAKDLEDNYLKRG